MHIESLGTYKSSFVLSVTPLSGESLSGLLARAAAYNVVYSPKDIFAMVGLPRGQLGSIATSCHLQISKIANVLGVDESVINQLFYKHGNEQPRRGEYISFCGMSLPVRAREGEFRRVSFHSLRNSPHHRASWELRFLPWCPESFEYLADACPSCDTQLGWRKFDGVHRCEYCSSDLRSFHGNFVPENRRRYAHSLSRLFSLNRLERTAERATLHDDLKGLPDIDLLKLIFIVGRSFQILPVEVDGILFSKKSADLEAKSDALLLGMQRILDWENSISSLLGESSRNADRESGYGAKNHFGAVVNYLRPKHSALSVLLKKAILLYCQQNAIVPLCRLGRKTQSTHVGWMKSTDLVDLLRTNNSNIKKLLERGTIEKISSSVMKRSPILVKSSDVARLQKECEDSIEVRHAEVLTGLPEFVLHELKALGFLMPAAPDVLALRGEKALLSKASLDDLEKMMLNRSVAGLDIDGQDVSIIDVIKMGAGVPFFASALFCGIDSGDVRLGRYVNEDLDIGRRFYAKASVIQSVLNSNDPGSAFAKNFEKMPLYISYQAAAQFLGVEGKHVYSLVRRRRLPTTKFRRYAKIKRAELYTLSAEGRLK